MLLSNCPSVHLKVLYRSFRLFLIPYKEHNVKTQRFKSSNIHSPNEANEDTDSVTTTDTNSVNSTFKDTDSLNSTDPDQFPEEPTTCCMSGCANCVWLDYVDKMSKYFKDGGDQAMKEIEEKIQDPNMKAFLMSELRMRGKINKSD